MWKKMKLRACMLVGNQQGQSLTEYILVIAFVALAFGLVLGTWNGPLAKFLNAVAQVISKTR
ncbi:MAG: hypothetical protein AB1439_06965 [candidate division FCPU426 bacterium]